MRWQLIGICLVSSTLAAAQSEDPGKRQAYLPTVRAATDCVARTLAEEGSIGKESDDELREIARLAFGGKCRREGQQLVSDHDRLYGAGTGWGFVDGPYYSDAPRALRQRMGLSVGKSDTSPSRGLEVTVRSGRCPDMLDIDDVRGAGREFAEIERRDLPRNPKSESGVRASFLGRMDDYLRQAQHAMAGPVLRAFRSLPPEDLGKCFPAIVTVMEEARELKFALEQRRLAEDRAREERAEFERREREEALRPVNVLAGAYSYYAFVKRCYEDRAGYISINISEAEMDRARSAIKGIERKMVSVDPNIDTDEAWKRGAKASLTAQSNRDACQSYLARLTSTFRSVAPDSAIPDKDF